MEQVLALFEHAERDPKRIFYPSGLLSQEHARCECMAGMAPEPDQLAYGYQVTRQEDPDYSGPVGDGR